MREIALTEDMWGYLELESHRRGVTVWDVYEMEEQAARDIDALGISEDFLGRAANVSRNRPFSPAPR